MAEKKKAAEVEGTGFIVENSNKTKKLAVISIKIGGSTVFKGVVFDSATRIIEAYARAAKKMGILVKKGEK